MIWTLFVTSLCLRNSCAGVSPPTFAVEVLLRQLLTGLHVVISERAHLSR